MSGRMSERVRWAAQALLSASNEGAFNRSERFPATETFGAVVDLLEAADTLETMELARISALGRGPHVPNADRRVYDRRAK